MARSRREAAERLAEAVNRNFFVPGDHSYRLFRDGGDAGYYEHTQILPLYLGIVPEDHRAALIENLIGGRYPEGTFSTLCYLIRALAPHGAAARSYLAARLSRTFRPLLDQGATTLWETPRGGADFSLAGSLCHGWSAASLYFDGAVRLGVEPLAEGFREFRFDPFCGGDARLSGQVSTPSGEIAVTLSRLSRTEIEAEITYPAHLICRYPPHGAVRKQSPGGLTLRLTEPC